ncbi:hypothetical protein [Streptomyces sp. NRRL F-5630]|uniref:hypothetical protein n=1 Tax=Streptomyces sp. NRRL F-5630 TaxID=1463864 RepID=UPI000AD4E52C|nr:hypothetical protein [Streptomyces sp. NRRL F-5630]
MAVIKSVGKVDVELALSELELIRRALRLVKEFGEVEDWEPARDLLADLEARA